MTPTQNTPGSAVVQRVWNYAHVLKDDGLAFMDYTEQITYLLFLKMAWEQRQAGASEIPSRYSWGALKRLNDNAKRLERYHQGLRKLSELSWTPKLGQLAKVEPCP
jgi:type I restriction enzyme M protein